MPIRAIRMRAASPAMTPSCVSDRARCGSSEGGGQLRTGSVRSPLDMDEARVDYWKAHFSGLGLCREELAFWAFRERAFSSASPEFMEALRRLVEAMGGPPSQKAMRSWLDAKFTARDAQAEPTNTKAPGSHIRQQACPHCSAVTTQTLHGFTVSGGLWKGHCCLCRGWECRGCGVVLDPKGECCR